MTTRITEAKRSKFWEFQKSIHADFQQEANTDECLNSKTFVFISLTQFSHCTEAYFGTPQSHRGNSELTPMFAYNSLEHSVSFLPCASAGPAAAQWSPLPRAHLLLWPNQVSKPLNVGQFLNCCQVHLWGKKNKLHVNYPFWSALLSTM